MSRNFIVSPDGRLCMDGYPVAIRRHPPGTANNPFGGGVIDFEIFTVEENGHKARLALSLSEAKRLANDLADNIDVFTPA